MSSLVRGAIAGAVGTIALDAATYADMALRARPSSGVPAKTVQQIAVRAGRPIENGERATALGALSGYAIGVGIGVGYALVRTMLPRAPLAVASVAIAAAAMAASDIPAQRLGATDPRTWGASGWLADIIPHLVYGLVTASVVEYSDQRELRRRDGFDALDGAAREGS